MFLFGSLSVFSHGEDDEEGHGKEARTNRAEGRKSPVPDHSAKDMEGLGVKPGRKLRGSRPLKVRTRPLASATGEKKPHAHGEPVAEAAERHEEAEHGRGEERHDLKHVARFGRHGHDRHGPVVPSNRHTSSITIGSLRLRHNDPVSGKVQEHE